MVDEERTKTRRSRPHAVGHRTRASCNAQRFKIAIQNRVDLAGLQVIGWDTDAEMFRSWIFDSAGGFANDEWTKEGDRWIVKSAGVLFGGQKSSAVRIITPIDDDSFTLEAVDREVDGELFRYRQGNCRTPNAH